jgi:hypothetical protein
MRPASSIRLAAAGAALVWTAAATAQITPPPAQPSRQPAQQGPRLAPFGPSPAAPARPQPEERPTVEGTPVRLTAFHHEGSAPIARGLHWRIYVDQSDAPGGLRFVTESTESQPLLRLPPGGYIVSAAYGRASLTRRVMVGQVAIQDGFILNAGGLRLAATVGARRLPDGRVSYSVYTGPGPGGASVVEGARGGRILRLPVGDYHVVSRYGEANAIMSGDVRVQPGRLTEATLHHRAAQVTLKLVSEPGGEAIASTAWSVLTPGGDAVQESIGAFPSMVLAAGDYTVIARNEGRVYSARFTVEVGQDREVEVLAR